MLLPKLVLAIVQVVIYCFVFHSVYFDFKIILCFFAYLLLIFFFFHSLFLLLIHTLSHVCVCLSICFSLTFFLGFWNKWSLFQLCSSVRTINLELLLFHKEDQLFWWFSTSANNKKVVSLQRNKKSFIYLFSLKFGWKRRLLLVQINLKL